MSDHSTASTLKGIKYVSFHEASGYGTAARRYLRGLKNMGIPFTWTPMIPGKAWRMGYQPFLGREIENSEFSPFCNISLEYDVLIVHTVPEYYPIWAAREPGKRVIGMTVWETDRIPDHWPRLLNQVDHLLVPTHWNQKVFENCGVSTPIDVIPHIISEAEPRNQEILWEIDPNDYVFYTIGTWTTRKAIWNTIRSYLNTFTAQDQTVLVIKTSRKDFTRRNFLRHFKDTATARQKILVHYPHPAKIKLITDQLNEEDILKLHQRGDCYISLCRSEGWGLGSFDAAGFGNPVIITGFGGQTEYLPKDLAFLVDYKIIPVVDKVGQASYSSNQNWAEPDLSLASKLMRQVFEHRREARVKGEKLRQQVKKNFNEKVITKKLIYAITRELRSECSYS